MNFKFTLLAIAGIAIFTQCGPDPEKSSGQNDDAVPKIKSENVVYSTEQIEMSGYFAYDTTITEKRPGILVVHEWWGQNDYVRRRADMLAGLGYVAFAIDMYGNGATAEHPEDAMGFSSEVMQNMDESKARFEVAYKTLSNHPMVDNTRISAVGYCFGGSVAMSMANAGMDLDGVAAFHSGVMLPIPPSKELVARMLVQNGEADPMITAEQAAQFKDEMDAIGADLEYISYPGVMHAYTNPDATAMGEKFDLPLKYDADADAKSWEKLQEFLGVMYK